MTREIQDHPSVVKKRQSFRLDVELHDLLHKPDSRLSFLPPPPDAQAEQFAKPVFPQYPELLTDAWLPQGEHGAPDNPYKRHWTADQVFHTMRGQALDASGRFLSERLGISRAFQGASRRGLRSALKPGRDRFGANERGKIR